MPPKSLLLDLLRVTPGQALPVRALVKAAGLFGVSGNALRVALTRLAQAGLVESDERGRYQLTYRADPLSRFVERWRLGEARRSPWERERGEHWWLQVALPRGTQERSQRRESVRALTLLGFREALEGLWVRPANLAQSRGELYGELLALGLERDPNAEPLEMRTGFAITREHAWREKAWKMARLHQSYVEVRIALETSAGAIEQLPLETALAETFLLGGWAIRILATDPLLPDEILPSKERAALTTAMLDYDALGRGLWSRLLTGVELEEAPAHVAGVGASL